MSDDLSLHSPTQSHAAQGDHADDSSDLLAAFDPFPSSSPQPSRSNYQICYPYSASKILGQCVPTRVPRMVKLVKFWDTETAAVLLLEYATGGLLWRRLRLYFDKARRLFKRYYEKKSSGDEKERHVTRRSGSVDNAPAGVKKRNATFSIDYRRRSGSDPRDRQSRAERNFSTTSETFEDEADEFEQAARLRGNGNDSSLFAML